MSIDIVPVFFCPKINHPAKGRALQIEVFGVPEALAKLTPLEQTAFLEGTLFRAATIIQGELAQYPSQPSGTTYRRTGTLGRRWTSRKDTGGDQIAVEVGNNTEYAPYVMGQGTQARWNSHWQTDAQIAESALPTIQTMIQAQINAIT